MNESNVVQTEERIIKIVNLAVESVLYATNNDETNILHKMNTDASIPVLSDIAIDRVRINLEER